VREGLSPISMVTVTMGCNMIQLSVPSWFSLLARGCFVGTRSVTCATRQGKAGRHRSSVGVR
jgi:hypothetical protein